MNFRMFSHSARVILVCLSKTRYSTSGFKSWQRWLWYADVVALWINKCYLFNYIDCCLLMRWSLQHRPDYELAKMRIQHEICFWRMSLAGKMSPIMFAHKIFFLHLKLHRCPLKLFLNDNTMSRSGRKLTCVALLSRFEISCLVFIVGPWWLSKYCWGLVASLMGPSHSVLTFFVASHYCSMIS